MHRIVLLAMIATVACNSSTRTPREPPSDQTVDSAPQAAPTAPPAPPRPTTPPAAASPAAECTLGALTDCCAHQVDFDCSGVPVPGTRISANGCDLDCRAGETIVDLAPNVDEARYGCVACPSR